MADALLRDLERRFEANPEDPEVLARLDEEFGRARRDLPWSALVRCQRWRGFVDFAARFIAPLGPQDGVPVAQLDRAESRLGVRMPVALREWYRLAGRRPDVIGGAKDQPVAADELRLRDGVLVIYTESQYVFQWGMLEEELGLDDPRIVTREEEGDAPTVWHERLSGFCWHMSLHHRLYCGGTWSAFAELSPDDTRARLEAVFPRLPFPGWAWGGEADTITHFGDREIVLELDISMPCVHVAAASGAALDRARAALSPLEPAWGD